MTTVEKGNDLEDKFYNYLLQQKEANELVYDAHNSELCQIYKKKKYYCSERDGDVEFDIVIEIFRKGAKNPYLFIVFECKNYSNSIPESDIVDFSDKLNRIFKHNSKGIFVVSSPLQSGAENLVKKRKIGLVKYSDSGFEIVLDRTANDSFLKKGIFENNKRSKPLKFSAYYEGKFCSSIKNLVQLLLCENIAKNIKKANVFVAPYISQNDIENLVAALLKNMNYIGGAVDLKKACSTLLISYHYINEKKFDENDNEILGFADFSKKEIYIHLHENKHRERFTLGHEIGHFCLGHDRFLRSETLIEKDLLIKKAAENNIDYERLEIQANSFASCLILPKKDFLLKIDELRGKLDIRNKGHGHIYVDDQVCNYTAYNMLISELSEFFLVSKRAIENKLKKLNLLSDNRKNLR